MPAAEHLRVARRDEADYDPAKAGPQPGRQALPAHQPLDACHGGHGGDRDHRGDDAEHGEQHIVDIADVDLGVERENRLGAKSFPDDQCAGERRHADRRQHRGRIVPDHQLERIERAGQWRIEGGGDRGGGAASDQSAQIAAPEAQPLAEPRRDAGTELRIGGFESDRSAEARRDDGEQGQVGAVVQRHLAAEERIGLDRIDDFARTPAADQDGGAAGQQTADGRDHEDAPPVEDAAFAQMPVRRDREGEFVDGLDQRLDDDHAEPDDGAEHGADDDERDLVVARASPHKVSQQDPHPDRGVMEGASEVPPEAEAPRRLGAVIRSPVIRLPGIRLPGIRLAIVWLPGEVAARTGRGLGRRRRCVAAHAKSDSARFSPNHGTK